MFDLNNFKILTSHKMQTLKDYNKHLEAGNRYYYYLFYTLLLLIIVIRKCSSKQ